MGKHTLEKPQQITKEILKSKISGKHRIYLWLYFSAITAAELVTTCVNPIYGIACHGLLLFGLLLHAAMICRKEFNIMYLALALAPLIRIMGMSMPLVRISPVYWYLAISIPLFAATAFVVQLTGLKSRDIGLAVGNLPVQILVALIGVPLGLIEYTILKPAPLVVEMTWQQIWLPALILLICTGFLEELIFRGVIFRAVVETFGRSFAVLHTSFIFAALHIIHRSPVDLVFVFTVALFFSVVVNFSRSLLGVSLAHGLTNIGLYLIWPFIL